MNVYNNEYITNEEMLRRAMAISVRPIRTKPEPHCPDCGGRMKLRKPRPSQKWQAFWSCKEWPDCNGTREILPDGRPEEDDPEPMDSWF
jgi:ssDNA-binding Zn-finger/Zn-ribbon topoisomerase 1